MSRVEPGGSGDVPEIDNGLYQAMIKEVKDISLEQADAFGNTEKVEIHLFFSDAEGTPHTLEPRVNRKWGEKATLFAIAQACGLDVDPHEGFDTEQLVDCQINVLVETPEEGKWPRVKSWTRVKASRTRQAAPAPSQKSAEASPGSVLNPDGTLDTNAFWRETRRLGMTRESVIADFNGDVESIVKGDPLEVAEWLQIKVETLSARL